MTIESVEHPVVVAPVRRADMAVTLTSPWVLNKSEYRPQNAGFQLLINGEQAFEAVHKAIEAATKSVIIVCWGFQPSMYFRRDGQSLPIGRLLEHIAEKKGVKVRILCWEVAPLGLRLNVTGATESNTPGRWFFRWKSLPPTTTEDQYKIDIDWYDKYDDEQEWPGELLKWVRARLKDDKKAQNIQFRGRGFDAADRAKLAAQHYEDDVSLETRGALVAAPSHHQKMVLVDYEDPKSAVGFVMGHNMLDAYWDTSDHSSRPRSLYRTGQPEPRPDAVANGLLPRHDFSSKVTGPILGDLFKNFASAWKRSGGDALAPATFENYPVRLDEGMQFISGQILRTQAQEGAQDIKRAYLQAVNNATQYIHIENQYFRWEPLADAIKAAAEKQTQGGRVPERDGYLYLFVITNSGDEGVGMGIDNTFRMMQALGRTDTMPQVARQEKLAEIERAKWEVTKLEVAQAQMMQFGGVSRAGMADLDSQLEAARARLKDLESQRDTIQKEYDDQQAKNAQGDAAKKPQDQWHDEIDPEKSVIQPEAIPGLKTHICTLVAPDTPDGEAWMEVYIHAKLMLIDDTFMTLGSANINTRSMQVDSELNLAHHRPEVTSQARRTLWAKHTAGRVGQEEMSPSQLMLAYQRWGYMLDRNRALRNEHKRPNGMVAPMVRLSASRANLD